MAKKINFTFQGKEYILEYNRKAIEIMERQGFMLEEVAAKPMTMLPALFRGAFLKNHPGIKRELVDDIYSKLQDKQKLIETLTEMYAEPIQALLEDPTGDLGNVEWGLS
jgi:hypothetical protein